MECKRYEDCPECRGRGQIERGITPEPTALCRPCADPTPEPGDFTTHWEPCAKCEGTGTVSRWYWVGL